MEGKLCKIKWCKNILKKKDGKVCGMHHSRFFRYKDYNYISPKWTVLKRGTPQLTKLGYLRININGKRILHHRYVMEQYLGRKLKKCERIHHLNGIKTDNRVENLKLFKGQSEHIKFFHKDTWKKRKIFNASIDWSKYIIPKHNNHKICLIDGCNLKTRTRCLCNKHSISFYRNYY